MNPVLKVMKATCTALGPTVNGSRTSAAKVKASLKFRGLRLADESTTKARSRLELLHAATDITGLSRGKTSQRTNNM